MNSALLYVRGVDKFFGAAAALAGAELTVGRGEVHALIGQNGAGKSTLIKILTGALRRDGGEIRLNGRPAAFSDPREAQAAGIGAIYQELNLIPLLSVAENICLGAEPMRFGMIHRGEMRRRARTILSRFGLDIDVDRPLGSYPAAARQIVAVARTVARRAKLVVMDEPTSSLDAREVETLFGVIREMKAQGASVLYVSHFLDELFKVCDRVTIMRDGRTVMEGEIPDVSKLRMIAAMLGREPEDIEAAGMTEFAAGTGEAGEALLEARNLRGVARPHNVSFSVRRGEIVGLAGLLGSGRTEVARILFGLDNLTAGEIWLDGGPFAISGPRAAIRMGMGFLTEDRKADGIVPQLSVRENITLALLPRLSGGARARRRKERDIVRQLTEALQIKAEGMEQPMGELSGGNQQKALLARWLATNPRLLILDEPTRGVDVGAKREIQGVIRSLAEKGLAAVMISSEFEEIAEGADRAVIMRDGKSAGELQNPGITEDSLIRAIAGPDSGSARPSGSADAKCAQ